MAFNVPINSIAPIQGPSSWVRPSDWIAITDTPNEVQFLVCDLGTKTFTIRTTFTRTSGNIYIDWGDGVIDTLTSTATTTTSHTYSTGGTACSRGYNTWKIRIYGDATVVIRNVKHISDISVTGGSPFYNVGLLEAYYGDNTCTTTSFTQSFYSVNINVGYSTFGLLEYVKLPSIVSWTTAMLSMFQNCSNLYVVIMPTSAPSINTMQSTFSGCNNLLDISIPSDAIGITSLYQCFLSCTNLRTVILPTSLDSCTSMLSAFNSCISLRSVIVPSMDLCTNTSTMFNGCTSLQWVKLNSLPSPASSGTTLTATSMFSACSVLQNVYLPSSCSSNAIYSAASIFSNCINLKNIVFPLNFDASTLSNAFANCYSITNITFNSAMPNLTILDSAFNSCFLLSSISLPTITGSSISLTSTFTNCYSLESITIPSGWVLSALTNTFTGCRNTTSITLPNNAQNSVTSMSATFQNCNSLETLILPTSLNSVSTLSSAFQNCFRLSSVTLPSTMNSVTTMASSFSACYVLSSVTLPTSMSACTNFSSIFNACQNIKTITFPATVSASTTAFNAAVYGCVSLETLTLPTTQTSAVTTINQIITGCGNLTTINNLNKIGSLTATPLVAGAITQGNGSWANIITSLSFSCPFSQFTFNASSTTTNFNKLNSLRLLNAGAGQYTGVSPQIAVGYCDLGIAALDQLFTDLPTITSKTINITGCTGAAGCTPSCTVVGSGILHPSCNRKKRTRTTDFQHRRNCNEVADGSSRRRRSTDQVLVPAWCFDQQTKR